MEVVWWYEVGRAGQRGTEERPSRAIGQDNEAEVGMNGDHGVSLGRVHKTDAVLG